MVYIAVRFDFRYGPGTVVALLHDAILVMGAFAITYKEFSLTTIAAILTVIGYSMNDTIVVFDRIRENASRLRDKKFDRVVNISINETLSRTILTSATVFFVTLAMNIFGTGVIRDFAFAMNVGVIVGTYSSIFVAARSSSGSTTSTSRARSSRPPPAAPPQRDDSDDRRRVRESLRARAGSAAPAAPRVSAVRRCARADAAASPGKRRRLTSRARRRSRRQLSSGR